MPRLIVLLLAGLTLTGVLAAEDPRQRLEAIEADIGRIDRWLSSSRRDRDSLQDELRRVDLTLADLSSRARRTREELDTHRRRVAELEREITELQGKEADARAAVQATIRQAWLLGRRGPLQLLLEAESPERIARLLAYHERLARARADALEAYRDNRRDLERSRTDLAATRDRLERDRVILDTQVAELAAARKGQAAALSRLEADIGAREASRAELARNQARLEELLERLSRQATAPTGETFAANRGKLPWPVDGRLLQGFETQRSGSRRTGGVLLAAEPGSTVRAVHPGRVVFADWMRGLGLLVILDHGGGYMSLYAQAESLLRNPGDIVEAGEPLATAGQSGGGSSSGVWFEIRRNGQPEDPGRWCRPPARA
ncbi:MAG: peptidase M23 [Gammaproteobacteria bacterium]|nr:MAG: peptidase M23 [Gammaproteobacteria bacterium]